MTNVHQDDAPELTVTEARQGRRGLHIVWVLVVSMALIVAGFIGLWLVNAPRNAHQATSPTVTSRAAARGFDTSPPRP